MIFLAHCCLFRQQQQEQQQQQQKHKQQPCAHFSALLTRAGGKHEHPDHDWPVDSSSVRYVVCFSFVLFSFVFGCGSCFCFVFLTRLFSLLFVLLYFPMFPCCLFFDAALVICWFVCCCLFCSVLFVCCCFFCCLLVVVCCLLFVVCLFVCLSLFVLFYICCLFVAVV